MPSIAGGLRETLSGLIVNTVSRLDVAIRDGRSYTQSRKYTSLAKGASKTVMLRNPADSYFNVEVTVIEVSGTSTATYEVLKNATITSEGTQMVPSNRNTGYPDESIVEMYHGTSYTDGTTFGPGVLSSGTINITNTRGSSIGFILFPGDNIVITLTNNSGASNSYHTRVSYQHRR